jgi:ribosomal protein S14
MPIRPEMRGFYSSDWAEISRRVRFERAAGVCQGCGRPHGIRFAVCRMGVGTTRHVAPGATPMAGRRAGLISSK